MKLSITASLIALSLTSSMAFATGNVNFGDDNKNWDKNGSQFKDANRDGNLTRDEYYGSMADKGVFSKWDSDNDSLLSENEFNEIDNDYDFDTWDTDNNNYLDSAEVYDGYYTAYDQDENGHWDGDEWDDAGEEGFWDF